MVTWKIMLTRKIVIGGIEIFFLSFWNIVSKELNRVDI